jgi:serralysin
MLNGNGETFSLGEVDTLTGGAGVDIFVLGDPDRSYYNDQKATTSGTGDYALITDFNINQDFIVLKGDFSDYIFKTDEVGTGVSIFLNNDGKTGFTSTDELIAQVQGVTEVSPIDLIFT